MQTNYVVREVTEETKEDCLKIKIVNKKSFKNIKDDFKFSNFKGDKYEIFLGDSVLWVGSNGIKDTDDWRTLGFKIGKELLKLKVQRASVEVPLNSLEFMQGIMLGSAINFEMYKSKKTKNKLKEVYFIPGKNDSYDEYDDLYLSLIEAKAILDAQTLTQFFVDMTAEDATSTEILYHVRNLFVKENSNIGVEVYDEDFLKKENMNGHLIVNRASKNPAMTIKLTYEPEIKSKKNIVLVGKGLTYDTGGLSIKPTNSMSNMQCDKAGAMTLIGLMSYLETSDCPNKVTCYIALAENSISGNSYRPGDVITMKNKKTVMIKNTDAEGRIVLYDNICLAQKQNKYIDELYSIATLTGSATLQFGTEAAGLVGFNDKMKKKLIKSGKRQGEIFLDAPFHKYMMDGVTDSVADLSNTGTPYQGCQKAGLFLTYALKNKNKNKFLHIDIAGPAYTDNGFGSYKAGASGFGVRSLIDLVGR